MNYNMRATIVIHRCNMGALQLASNDSRHGRTKHIDHHIRECVESRKVVLSQVATAENTADVLTNAALARVAFEKHTRGMGVTSSANR